MAAPYEALHLHAHEALHALDATPATTAAGPRHRAATPLASAPPPLVAAVPRRTPPREEREDPAAAHAAGPCPTAHSGDGGTRERRGRAL